MEKGNGGIGSHFSDHGFCQSSSANNPLLDYDLGNESNDHIVSQSVFQACSEQTAELGGIRNGKQDVVQTRFASASLELLKTHAKGMNRLGSERVIKPTIEVSSNGYSTEKIMRIAGERFMHSFTKTVDVVSMLDNPFGSSLSGLPDETAKKVELAELLMASAEKVANQLYDRARMLLNRCDELSSSTGNAVERVVYYFSKALRDRIDRENRKMTSQRLIQPQVFNFYEAITAPNPNLLAIYQEIPFPQIAHCAAIQPIIENVTRAKKIHVIDFGIGIGVQWTCLMQALVSESVCPLKLLKITAVGTTMKQSIEDTGKRLTSFAESIRLPFSFNIVMVSDMLELRKDLFELEANETVVIYSSYFLKSLIQVPDTLDYMMKVIRNLNPSIMVVTEPEVNSISTPFGNRFVEIIFYFSAYFDCLELYLSDNPNRVDIESLYLGETIRNILATDGEERSIRHVKLDVWRAFFARFGMVEMQISKSSLLHGKLMAGKFASGNACSLEMDGKSLLIGWKDTPLISLSAWKFKI